MSLGYIVTIAILGYTVFLILTDSASKNKSDKNEEPVEEEVKEVKTEEPKPKTVERRESTNTQPSGDGSVVYLSQGDDYRPVGSGQVVKTVTTVTYESVPNTESVKPVEEETHVQQSSKYESESSDNNSSAGEDMVKSICPYCDLSLDIPKGGSVVCPRCGGTISAD